MRDGARLSVEALDAARDRLVADFPRPEFTPPDAEAILAEITTRLDECVALARLLRPPTIHATQLRRIFQHES